MTEKCDHGSYIVLMFGERECIVCGLVELPPVEGGQFVLVK